MARSVLDPRRLVGALRSDPTLAEVSRILEDRTVWVVGGWIRDLAVRRVPLDLDLVVAGDHAAAGAAASRLARRFGGSPHRLGRPPRSIWALHGPKFKIEIWPLGLLSPEEDACRRDFSCNALLWRLPIGPMVDPTNGLEDLERGLIRAVDRRNLEDDPVRLLRGPRFAATMVGHNLEEKTRRWIADLAPLLGESPKERVGREFSALVRTPRPDIAFSLLVELGLFEYSSPHRVSAPSIHLPTLDSARRLINALPHPVPAAARLSRESALLAWIAAGWHPLDASGVAAFAWPREQVRTVVSTLAGLGAAHRQAEGTAADRREAISRYGDAFPTLLALAAALSGVSPTETRRWRRWWRQWRASGDRILDDPPLLSALEVADISRLPPGPALGALVHELRRLQIRRKVRTASGARRWVRAHSVADSTEPSSKSNFSAPSTDSSAPDS